MRSSRTRWSRRSEELGPQYDALFIDEAQDLTTTGSRR